MDYKESETTVQTKKQDPYRACAVYEGVCVCEQTFIGET